MLRRYPQSKVEEMPVSDGISLLTYALEKESDDKIFARWIGFAQYEVGFDEFKRNLQPKVINEKKTLEKLDELMDGKTWAKVPVRSE